MFSKLLSLSLLSISLARVQAAVSLPSKIYGVNLGSWCVASSSVFSWVFDAFLGCWLNHGCFPQVGTFELKNNPVTLMWRVQNGSLWAVNNAMIVQSVLPRNCGYQACDGDCESYNVNSEFARAYPDTVDKKFDGHWSVQSSLS